jgi:hypothetical protein
MIWDFPRSEIPLILAWRWGHKTLLYQNEDAV